MKSCSSDNHDTTVPLKGVPQNSLYVTFKIGQEGDKKNTFDITLAGGLEGVLDRVIECVPEVGSKGAPKSVT